MKIIKKSIASLFAIAMVFGALSFNSNSVNAQSSNAPSLAGEDTHSCVTTQDTPTHKEVNCVGAGTACKTVAIC